MQEINILVVDDHPMVRDGIRTMLNSQSYKYSYIIDEAGSVDDALKKTKDKNYDIVLMDYQLPVLNGGQLTRKILSEKSHLKILAMSGYDQYSYVIEMAKAGVRGYLLKNIGPTELTIAIETVLNGKPYYSKEITHIIEEVNLGIEKKLLDHRDGNDINISSAKIIKARGIYFTDREKQVIRLLRNSKTSTEIAEILGITKRSVDSIRSNMLKKLNAKNTVTLIQRAIELDLIKAK